MTIYGVQEKRRNVLLKIAAAAFIMVLLIAAGFGMKKADAAQLTPEVTSSDGYACDKITDDSYYSSDFYDPGTEITIKTGEKMDSLYIVWENIPGEWTLKVNGNEYKYGKEGYLHEYVKLPEEAESVSIVVGSSRLTICDIYAFSAGTLPDFVQTWDSPYEEADILLISTHADDEVLFFGGIIPTYIDRGARVQVAYFTDLFQTELYRNHEILNGLWTMGVTHYPQLGKFYDNYSESYEEAAAQYDYDASLEYIVGTIRRFHPQVVIGQDPLNGEYGHGGHMWCARIIEDALEVSGDASVYPESASQYGTWDVAKTYFHLYPDNQIVLDVRTPLSHFGGKTCLEVARAAYLEHDSQQWCWFYVTDDGYDASGNYDEKGYTARCTVYGLYRTTVGNDINGNDILENITTYDEQEKAAALAAQAETADAAADGVEEPAQNEGEKQNAQSVVNESSSNSVRGGKHTTILTVLIVIAAILLIVIAAVIFVSKQRAKMAAKKREFNRKVRMRNDGNSANKVKKVSGVQSRPASGSRPGMRSSSAGKGSTPRSQGMRSGSASNAGARNSRTSNGSYRSNSSDRRR